MGETWVVPLGGLGEVGLNCLAFAAEGQAVLVDCGCLFPGARHPGVDYLTPDLSPLKAAGLELGAVFLTHGHDDHVAAVPHLLRESPVPVYGTPMTLGLLERRLGDLAPGARGCLRSVTPGGEVAAGPFRAEFLRVTHSVPGACALGLTTPGGRVLHTGDFKFDPNPVEGLPTDEAALGRWGDRGVDLLCCDSTTAHRPGDTPPERAVAPVLAELIAGAPGRVYVATFASHAHRIGQAVAASRAAGRRVVLLGRAAAHSSRVARDLGHLKTGAGDLVSEPRSRGLAREALTVVLGGSQGEPGSALWRVAHGREPHHRLRPGDRVLFSARLIPGSEAAAHDLADRCVAQGAQVFGHDTPGLHVSGHPSAGDVVRMLDLTRPRQVLPVHGRLQHLEALAGLARRWGAPPDRVFRLRNGETLVLEGGLARPGPAVAAGRRYAGAGRLGDEGDGLLADRRRLARGGVALVQMAAGRVRVTLRGVVPPASVAAAERAAQTALERHLAGLGAPAPAHEDWEREVARALRRHFRGEGEPSPLVVVAVDGPAPSAAVVDAGAARPLQ
ncbi:MAG: ribonuclease J [Deferrisomatales bacterium]